MSHLLHYSAEPISFDRSRAPGYAAPGKPPGFWFSVEGSDDWPAFCEGAEWGLERLAVAYEVVLAPNANVLRVTDATGFDEFEWKYAPSLAQFSALWPWTKLLADFDGVIIAPYQWERRLESMWYYGWDCASGVIWNLDAIAELRLVQEKAR
jgi:hypothetical protein